MDYLIPLAFNVMFELVKDKKFFNKYQRALFKLMLALEQLRVTQPTFREGYEKYLEEKGSV